MKQEIPIWGKSNVPRKRLNSSVALNSNRKSWQ